MPKNSKKGILLPPAVGYSLSVLARLLSENRVSLRYLPRLGLTLLINLVNLPFRAYERLFINPRMAKRSLDKAPIFIIGHWRSGTTHLHNLLSQDPGMAYATTFQSVFPDTLFSWLGRPLFEGFARLLVPGKRKGDNVKLGMRLPQEEEFALGDKSPLCFYYFWMFPRRIREYYRRYVRMEGLSDSLRESWTRDYRLLVLKAIRETGRERFLSKNPPNTGRVRFLLERYPGARFIHIHRDPVEVFLSTQNFFRKMMPHLQLQTPDEEQVTEDIFALYRMLMSDYLEQRGHIPEGQLVEVAFDDLEKSPLETSEEIYKALDLEGWNQAKPHFEAYIDRMEGYVKNRHSTDPALLERIKKEWGFAMEEWGYNQDPKSH